MNVFIVLSGQPSRFDVAIVQHAVTISRRSGKSRLDRRPANPC